MVLSLNDRYSNLIARLTSLPVSSFLSPEEFRQSQQELFQEAQKIRELLSGADLLGFDQQVSLLYFKAATELDRRIRLEPPPPPPVTHPPKSWGFFLFKGIAWLGSAALLASQIEQCEPFFIEATATTMKAAYLAKEHLATIGAVLCGSWAIPTAIDLWRSGYRKIGLLTLGTGAIWGAIPYALRAGVTLEMCADYGNSLMKQLNISTAEL